MTQLTFGDLAAKNPLPDAGDQWLDVFRALEAIAASTLLEFDSALAWGQWCRRMAADAITKCRSKHCEGKPAARQLSVGQQDAEVGVGNAVVV